MQVQRSRVQVQALISDLQTYLSPVSGSSLVTGDGEVTTADMEASLNNLIQSHPEFSKEPWNCSVLIAFLDNSPVPPYFNSAMFSLLKNKVIFPVF